MTEIYCDAFGENKRIAFSPGLNIIQGIGGSEDGPGANSIGKTTMLKIIDYAFGGKYYSDSNKDIIKYVGKHDICFTHFFNGISYYFKRDATKPGIVSCCADNSYTPQREISSQDFCKWLVAQYGLQNLDLTFREIVSLYSRIWDKPNKDVNRPLFRFNAQSVRNAIMSLIKLFEKHTSIQELYEQDEYLRKRQTVIANAVSYNLIEIPSKAEYSNILKELSEVQEKISSLEANISIASIDNIDSLFEQENSLYQLRQELLVQQGRAKRDLYRCQQNMKKLSPLNRTTFTSLQEFFPEIDIRRVEAVQSFHDNLCSILLSEFQQEESKLKQLLEEIKGSIQSVELKIQTLTELPMRTTEAIALLQQLAKRQDQLQTKLNLYNDKAADLSQKIENSKKLSQALSAITSEIQVDINEKICEYSAKIKTSNNKAPLLQINEKDYHYGVEDNTGTGKAYTDLLLFDLAILALTKLPILIHDSFLFNNIDDQTKFSLLRLYGQFPTKQLFISLDQYYGYENESVKEIIDSSVRLTLSGKSTLFGTDWRT